MRIPLQTYGFSLSTFRPVLDLRNAVEGTEDILYFLTLRHHGRSTGTKSIRIVDDRDDGPIITFPSVPFEPVFERLPVRGPVAVLLNAFPLVFSTTFTGHLELEGPDEPTFFIPLATQVFEEKGTARVCRIESSVNLSLFLHSPDVSSKCTLRFAPDEPADVLALRFEGPNLGSAQPDNGFVQVFDRMPLFGPGRIEIDIDSVDGGPISLYGFLSD